MLAWSASSKLKAEILERQNNQIMGVPLEVFKRSNDRRARGDHGRPIRII
jgi:hypothetical protein